VLTDGLITVFVGAMRASSGMNPSSPCVLVREARLRTLRLRASEHIGRNVNLAKAIHLFSNVAHQVAA
jgi:hypothetical protein